MYKELPLNVLVPNRNRANRVPRMYAKKLRHNIERIGFYEPLTVRPHPKLEGRFEILNGHARFEVLRALGASSVKCDIWEVNEIESRLFLAVLNKLRGEDIAELRMGLLFDLLQEIPQEELAAHVPETSSYLKKLEALRGGAIDHRDKKLPKNRGTIALSFYIEENQQRVISTALDDIAHRYGLSHSDTRLAKMAQLYLENVQDAHYESWQ